MGVRGGRCRLTRCVVGVEPKYMGISPIYAIPKVLEQAGLSKEDVDVYEVRMLDFLEERANSCPC